MTFYWFPILKLLITAILLYIAAQPFIKSWQATETLPKKKFPYLFVGVIVVMFFLSPFKLTPGEQSERVIRSFDTPTVETVPEIEVRSRTLYGASDNRKEINKIMEEK